MKITENLHDASDSKESTARGDHAQQIVDNRFRPHVVHFSGHGDDDLIVFEDELDEHHAGVIVTARAFASAVKATDDPPLLVLLNSCNSAAQIDHLVESVAPFVFLRIDAASFQFLEPAIPL